MTSDSTWGSALVHERTIEPRPRKRRRCNCGCGGRATHVGLAGGVVLVGGCEWVVRMWIRDPTWHLPSRMQGIAAGDQRGGRT